MSRLAYFVFILPASLIFPSVILIGFMCLTSVLVILGYQVSHSLFGSSQLSLLSILHKCLFDPLCEGGSLDLLVLSLCILAQRYDSL